MKINTSHQKAIFLGFFLAVSFWTGRLSVQYQLHNALPPVQSIDEINPKIPMVTVTDISHAKIIGKVNKPEIRIQSDDQVAVPNDDLSFELDIQHLGYIGDKRPTVKIQIPEWARFVASKNGQYYYELDESSAKKLSPQNQVYFATEEDASTAGYKKRER